MTVFRKSKDDVRHAGIRSLPTGLRTVVEMRELPKPGILVGYAELGNNQRAVYLFPRSFIQGGSARQEGPFAIVLFVRSNWSNGMTRKIRSLAGDHGLEPEEFLREVLENAPGDWQD